MHRYETKLEKLRRAYSRRNRIVAAVWLLVFIAYMTYMCWPLWFGSLSSGENQKFEIVLIGVLAFGNVVSEGNARRLAGEVIELLQGIIDDDREKAKLVTNASQAE